MQTVIDREELTRQQKAVWSAGDFARVASMNVLAAEMLCESIDLHPGERVLDVAAGSGNTALAAARRRCEVTATDSVPSLLEAAKTIPESGTVSLPVIDDSKEGAAAVVVVLSGNGVVLAKHATTVGGGD